MNTETGQIRAVLAALSSLLLGGCDEPRPASATTTMAANTAEVLPVRWTLTDVDGRMIDATIIGRTERTITLIRSPDQQRFNLGVERLSPTDRQRIARLPLSAAPAPSKPPQPAGPLVFREADLVKVRAEIEDVSILLSSSDSMISTRSLQSQLKRLRAREAELMREIQRLRRE